MEPFVRARMMKIDQRFFWAAATLVQCKPRVTSAHATTLADMRARF
jgi:hypothetical protein